VNTIALTIAITAGAYAALGIIVALQFKYCKRWVEPLAWLVLAIDGLLFSVSFVYFVQQGITEINGMRLPTFYNYWAIALRYHFLVTAISIEGARYIRMRRKHGC